MSQRIEKVMVAALAMQRHNWEQGVLAQAFLEAGKEEFATAMALEGAHRQAEDGRCAHLGGGHAVTDGCAIGEALVFAARKTGEPDLIRAEERMHRWALETAPRSDKGIVYHMTDRKEFWTDSFYMLPPYLAAAGEYDEALKQIEGYWEVLYDRDKHLVSHMWNDGNQCWTRKDFWGVGNGWTLAGLTRVMEALPEKYEQEKEILRGRIESLLKGILTYLTEDGMFHDVLDRPDTFKEVNCGQMTAYVIYRGIRKGWLDYKYRSYADRMRGAAIRETDRYGIVHNVCGAPNFDRPGSATEGQAFHILMETEWERQ